MQSLTMDDWSKGDFSFVCGRFLSDSEKPSESALNSLKYIYTDITDIKKSYIRLGFHLSEFNRCKYYLEFGFGSISEMAEANFGMDKGAVSRCIGVFRRFCQKQGHSCKMMIDDRFKDFSYSQLLEMLPLDDDVIRKITPDMSVRQIREFKKKKQSLTVATSQLINDVKMMTKNEESNPKFSDIYSSDDVIVLNGLFNVVFQYLRDSGFNPYEIVPGTAKQRSFELADGKVLTVRLSFSKPDSSS